MNGATIEASKETIEAISKCGFVDGVYLTRNDDEATSISARSINKRIVEEAQEGPGDDYVLQTTNEQLQLYNLLPLHRAGYKGKGIRIGVADGGFYRADSLDWLPREQWLGYADLTDDADGIFGRTGNHGSLCLGTIVARRSDYEGAATEASYYLFKTEEAATESIKEIDNWVAAIEMADSLGLHIVSTSLGYTTFDDEATNWSYADMDGKTSRGAQAAVIAARKGMLLVVAMGNDGAKAWHYLSTPADADSILSVGAVNREGTIAKFSSYGPSADGRVKPEVCALGEGTTLLDVNNGNVFPGNGTSFACPLIAGMAACLWSALPEASNMAIREMIIRSADRYTQPQEQYGYGIPDAWKAYTETTGVETPTQEKEYQKYLDANGQMYILYHGEKYTLLGNKI
jgi:subtilisin family serine protease